MYLIFLESDNQDVYPVMVGIEETKEKAIETGLNTTNVNNPFGYGILCTSMRLELWDVGATKKSAEHSFVKLNNKWYELVEVDW
jgi:hypothetical protein